MAIAAARDASPPTGDVTLTPSPLGGWNPITLNSVRSQPGMWLSGNPPSEPCRSLKRAMRFVMAARDRPIRGSFSIVSSARFALALTLRRPSQGGQGPRRRMRNAQDAGLRAALWLPRVVPAQAGTYTCLREGGGAVSSRKFVSTGLWVQPAR